VAVSGGSSVKADKHHEVILDFADCLLRCVLAESAARMCDRNAANDRTWAESPAPVAVVVI
jgi:hypothetical protein